MIPAQPLHRDDRDTDQTTDQNSDQNTDDDPNNDKEPRWPLTTR
jgi:hypothetical protein